LFTIKKVVYICKVNKAQQNLKTRKMKTFVQKTNEIIKERGLSYSPELFAEILKELQSNENNIKEESERQSKMIGDKNFKANRMTAYGMNKRPY
jgi:hypothetical protein